MERANNAYENRSFDKGNDRVLAVGAVCQCAGDTAGELNTNAFFEAICVLESENNGITAFAATADTVEIGRVGF